jgi:hypothetical protein
MLTKTKFAQFIFDQVLNGQEFEQGLIYQSSTLAVAAQFLGKLTSKDHDMYAAARGGVFIHYVKKVGDQWQQAILSVRQILAALPASEDGDVIQLQPAEHLLTKRQFAEYLLDRDLKQLDTNVLKHLGTNVFTEELVEFGSLHQKVSPIAALQLGLLTDHDKIRMANEWDESYVVCLDDKEEYPLETVITNSLTVRQIFAMLPEEAPVVQE